MMNGMLTSASCWPFLGLYPTTIIFIAFAIVGQSLKGEMINVRWAPFNSEQPLNNCWTSAILFLSYLSHRSLPLWPILIVIPTRVRADCNPHPFITCNASWTFSPTSGHHVCSLCKTPSDYPPIASKEKNVDDITDITYTISDPCFSNRALIFKSP